MMFLRAKTTGRPRGPLALLRRLAADRRAVAAVEFAFIAPVLLSLYFVTMEVAQAIETSKKVGRVGSTVADLITQQMQTNTDQLDAIMEIGSAILTPYNRSKPEIVVTAIQITGDEDTPKADADAIVAWSRKLDNGAFGEGPEAETETTVPEQLKIPGTFLIRVESKLDYSPVITWSASQKASLGLAAAFDSIDMHETYYLRPRMSNDISCDDCAPEEE